MVDRKPPQRARSVLATSALVVLCGCSSNGSLGKPLGPPASTSPSASSSSTPSSSSLTGEIAPTQAAFYDDYLRAFARPSSPVETKPLLDLYVPSSPARNQISQRLKNFVSQGWALRPGRKGYYRLESVIVEDAASTPRATARVCTYDDAVVYDATRTAPDGSRIVVDDSVQSARTLFVWTRVNGVWKLEGSEVQQTWKGVNKCPPR